ncbi:hypothetical protein QR680_013502 [Steinernema hermaphroditum]|uniref:Uncharacterized protein n=1 Tax=Steinernema hermaphroditum TaxID=289476 RepID=A0AA39I7B0_9BILA|nr:hypothetical protein QR680_013502 [Steinernema hermaphroditum]
MTLDFVKNARCLSSRSWRRAAAEQSERRDSLEFELHFDESFDHWKYRFGHKKEYNHFLSFEEFLRRDKRYCQIDSIIFSTLPTEPFIKYKIAQVEALDMVTKVLPFMASKVELMIEATCQQEETASKVLSVLRRNLDAIYSLSLTYFGPSSEEFLRHCVEDARITKITLEKIRTTSLSINDPNSMIQFDFDVFESMMRIMRDHACEKFLFSVVINFSVQMFSDLAKKKEFKRQRGSNLFRTK